NSAPCTAMSLTSAAPRSWRITPLKTPPTRMTVKVIGCVPKGVLSSNAHVPTSSTSASALPAASPALCAILLSLVRAGGCALALPHAVVELHLGDVLPDLLRNRGRVAHDDERGRIRRNVSARGALHLCAR